LSVQRYTTRSGKVRYRARVKFHGRYVATRVFERKKDAVAWEDEQMRKLRMGAWIDPKRGQVPLSTVAHDWLMTRNSVKRRTREADHADWRLHIAPRFGDLPVNSITTAEVASWVGGLIDKGVAPSSAARYLATLRSILAYAIADGRIYVNVAAAVKPPSGRAERREGQFLTVSELYELHEHSRGKYADVVLILGFAGLRWGECAGLQVGDLVSVPGRGLRLQRAVLASGAAGELYVDTLKNKRARTVPLVDPVVPIVDRWAEGKDVEDWLFPAPGGGPLHEGNWKRSVNWARATSAIGMPNLRVHDLRHTAASVWLAAGADAKVVQRILGHASAAMTMDVYGHLVDHNLWEAAKRVSGENGDISGTQKATRREITDVSDEGEGL